jgi:hypothetical protein
MSLIATSQFVVVSFLGDHFKYQHEAIKQLCVLLVTAETSARSSRRAAQKKSALYSSWFSCPVHIGSTTLYDMSLKCVPCGHVPPLSGFSQQVGGQN